MSLQKTLVLAVLLIAAVLYIVKIEMPREEAKKSEGVVFAGVEKENVESVEISNSKGSFVLKNAAPEARAVDAATEKAVDVQALDKWEIVSLEGAPLDQSSLNALLSAILGLKLEEPLPKQDLDTDLSVYGLKEPELVLTIREGGKDTLLTFGKENSYVYKRYLRVGENGDIYLVPTGLFSAANKSRADFRSKTPVSFVDSEVRTISIRNQSGVETKFEAAENYQWQMVEPARYSASASALSALTRDLRALRIAEFIDGAPPADFGLDAPDAKVELSFKTEAKQPLELSFKAQRKDGKEEVFMSSNERSGVVRLDSNPLASILKSPDEFRETKLFAFATDQVVQADFQPFQESPVSLVKHSSGWTVNGKVADENFVRGLLESLSELRAAGFPADNRDYGFANPRLKVVVRLSEQAGGSKERTLVVGDSAVKEGREDTRYYASVDGGKETFTIDKQTLKAITAREEVLLQTAPATSEQATEAVPMASGS